MSEQSQPLMMKTILGHLETGLNKLENGQLSPEDMELLVEDAKELYERLIILRYKVYETNVLGVTEPVISASIRQPEIEEPIDLFGVIEPEEPTVAPVFEVSFGDDQNEEDPIAEEEFVMESATTYEEESEEEEITEDSQVAEDSEKELEEESEEEEMLEEAHEEETTPVMETPVAQYEPSFSSDQPIWMAEMEANIRDNRSVFPLETLIGAFTLNEKLQFINELFDGSSDAFSSGIKQLDQLGNMDAARSVLSAFATDYNWDTESEIVEDFIYKVCRRYAAGA
ncbi:MAG: hypothetical protein RLZZ301_1054 [Bacteroidota bacterium]|jgi:hypothetical protein